ncbi:MAG TPA: hypothetical protein VJW55_00860 [Candidatus Angelobacter sp.]|nr:hypothetical protein [Candidatus Angelobacter sp.]
MTLAASFCNDFPFLLTRFHRATMLLSLAQPVAVDLAIQFKRSPFASAGLGKEKDDLLKICRLHRYPSL